jgi:hypothetical protein
MSSGQGTVALSEYERGQVDGIANFSEQLEQLILEYTQTMQEEKETSDRDIKRFGDVLGNLTHSLEKLTIKQKNLVQSTTAVKKLIIGDDDLEPFRAIVTGS